MWTRVCIAPMTQFRHLAAKLADPGAQSQSGNNFTQQCSSHRQEQHQSIRDWHTLSSAGWRSGYCCRVLTAEDYHQMSLSHTTDSTGHINSSVTSFCRTSVFSLCHSVKALKGKYHIPWTYLPQAHMGFFQLLSLTTNSSWFPWGGLPCLSSALWCQYP